MILSHANFLNGSVIRMHSISDFMSNLLSGHSGDMSFIDAIGAIVIAYFGGVLASLTPCVYPMIPITVSVVGGIGPNRRSWKEVVIRGAAYVGGMTVVYSFLGVLAGISGKIFGSFTNNATWYLGLGIIMTLAALIMLDIIPFDPAVWIDRFKRRFQSKSSASMPLNAVKKEMTHLSAFFLGASSGLIAAPCTTPVLTSILAYIAKTQSVGLGFALMFSFSLGLGTLLIVIAAFAGAVQVLPRSGQWMKTVKVFSGLILLAFAEYLIYRAGGFGGS
jgi:cytochrome c-type biogenesis protein